MTEIEGFVLGVDLGTSHTVAMLRHPDGRTRPLLFDGRPLMPSAIFRDATGRLHVGADALRLGHAEPARLEPNPKRRVDDGTVLLGDDTEVPVADLFAALLGAVAREAVAIAGFLPPAVLTHPAAWGDARRGVLVEALGRAGWPRDTRLVPEPVAAARYFAGVLRRPVPAGGSLAVFDFGGGTLDVAVVRNDGPGPDGWPRFSVTASGGADDLGGLDLDAALVDHLGKSLSAGEPDAWQALTDPVTLAQWRARRQFWTDVREAKEMLSRSSFAPVPVPGVEQAVHVTRDELESVADPLVRRGVTEAAAVLAAAGLDTTDLAGLFLVGGSSRVPLVARLLHSELGIAPTVLEQPELPVAEGALLPLAEPVRFAQGLAPAAPPAAAPPSPATAPQSGPPAAPSSSTAPQSSPPAASSSSTAPQSSPPAASSSSTAPQSSPPAASSSSTASQSSPPAASSSGTAPQSGPPAASSSGTAPQSSPPAASSSGTAPYPALPPTALQPAPPITDTRAESIAAGPAEPAVKAVPPPRTPDEPTDERLRSAPVDPWATGEVAAMSTIGQHPLPGAHGHPTPTPTPTPGPRPSGPPARPSAPPASGPPASRPPAGAWQPPHTPPPVASRKGRRRRAYIIGVALSVTLVLAAGAVLAWVFWPRYGALDYRPLSEPRRVQPLVPVGFDWADAAITGDRVYFASSSRETGSVGVVAADVGSGKTVWQSTDAGLATAWESMVALPVGVAIFTARDTSTDSRRVAVLGADDGKLLWERTMGDDDLVYFAGDSAVVTDHEGKRLVGLRLTDGRERWSRPDPASTSTVTPAVYAVTTPKDLSGPAGVLGRPLQPDLADDPRLVQIGADRSARVINANTGAILTSRQSVADPNDEVVAHNGRLIVLQSDSGDRRVVSYQLDRLGEPESLYTPQQRDTTLKSATSCGDDRVCFVELTGYDSKTSAVVALDVAERKRVWRYTLPNTDKLVPVGGAVIAITNLTQTSLIDADGKQIWARPGEAARLDAGNILEFSKQLTGAPDDPALAGRHIGDDAVPLGSLRDIRTDTCAWNTTTLACAGRDDFVLQDFAG